MEDCKSPSEITERLYTHEKVFQENDPSSLPPERQVEMKIELEENSKPTMGPTYKLSKAELDEMKRHIDELLTLGFI